jgi:apolipoprotein D and lipocalin family protein
MKHFSKNGLSNRLASRLAPTVLGLSVIVLSALTPSSSLAMGGNSHPPLRTVSKVDLASFMGDWHVLGNIPSSTEKGCHNALEQYALRDDGEIDITFSCHKGSFEGEHEVHHFRGLIQNPGINTEWRVAMKFLGFIPIKVPYLVIDLAADGSYTVIGYPSRDYVWIMARTKSLPEETWSGILSRLQDQGYDISKILRIPTQ